MNTWHVNIYTARDSHTLFPHTLYVPYPIDFTSINVLFSR